MDIYKYCEVTNKEWDNCLTILGKVPFAYYSEWIEFQAEYMERAIVANESCVFLVDKQPVCVIIIFVEKWNNINQISWENGYCTAPYVSKKLVYGQQEKYINKALEYIDEICEKYHCEKILLGFDSKSNPDFSCYIYNYNWLMRAGYRDTSSLTQILDLRENMNVIRSRFRKGHKSDVKRGQENYKIEMLDALTVKEKDINECKKIYELDAGRITRTSEMIMHYYNFISNGHGILGFAVNQSGERIATIIATFIEKTGYYLLYAEITDKTNGIPPGHVLQFELIRELQNRGVEFYELGEQIFNSTQSADLSNYLKEKNISFYKRGFGGYTVPNFRGEKDIDYAI